MDFPPHAALPAEERRLIDRASYDAWSGPRLAGCLNVLAALRAARLDRFVRRIERAEPSRLFVAVDPALRAAVAQAGWLGPEASGLLHGRYDVSFREARVYTALQVCFAGDAEAEIDVDEENPAAGDPWAALAHVARVARHRVFRQQTDPAEIRAGLRARGIVTSW